MKILITRVVFGLILLCSCQAKEKASAPDRPDRLPDSSVWRGGVDGGWWVNCEGQTSRLMCSTYWENGEIYSKQLFGLCSTVEASQWFGYPDGEGLKAIPAITESILFRPLEPATFYRDGQPDTALTNKYAVEFEGTVSPKCVFEFAVE